jgi:GTP-binding protein HflX
MADTQIPSQSVVLICPHLSDDPRSPQNRLSETRALAASLDFDIIHTEQFSVREIRSGTFISRAVIDRLNPVIESVQHPLVLVDQTLTPIQQRNLEESFGCKVIDRTGLILEIFGARARTHEGRLQVELAALTYQKSRLVRSWTHLERQRGGGGFTGGPGERQIELDRRLIDDRCRQKIAQLEKVKKTRALHRVKRQKVPYPVVALVGYTNAGKSSLFNRLCQAEVYAQDQLFATLDPTLRLLVLPNGKPILLADTVGFISDLPTSLIAAFRATLEEVLEADLLIHVHDGSNPDHPLQALDVTAVLEELKVSVDKMENTISVFNKRDLGFSGDGLAVSAHTGEGCDVLLETIQQALFKDQRVYDLCLSASDGKALNWLHQQGDVQHTDYTDNAEVVVKVKLAESDCKVFQHLYHCYVKL